MDFIKNNFLLIIVLLIAIYLVYKYWKKNNITDSAKNNSHEDSNFNAISNVVKSNNGPVNNSQIVVKPQVIETNPINWRIGDKLYAGSTGTNIYSAPSPSQSNIIKFYNKDSYIGTYLGNVNGYAKIIHQSQSNVLLDAFGWEDNQVVYSVITQIYKK